MKQIITDIAKAIVDYPDEVEVVEKNDGGAVYLQLSVAESDMGKVIGKQGRIAKAIRTVVKAYANHSGKKVIVDIV